MLAKYSMRASSLVVLECRMALLNEGSGAGRPDKIGGGR